MELKHMYSNINENFLINVTQVKKNESGFFNVLSYKIKAMDISYL